MEEIKIRADNIDGAAEEIIGFLEGRGKGTDVTYFDGWGGLGASAVLKAVAKRVRSSSTLSSSEGASTGMTIGLDKIIHIDCSLWQSKRALQKAIAEELELSEQVMAIFDQRDEEDDFDGVEQGARGVIPRVREAILDDLNNRRYLVVFHNGSNGYINFKKEGVVDLPRQVPASRRKRGGCEEVSRVECILYTALIKDDDDCLDWGTHAHNYWVCDGIIQATTYDRSAWEIGEALRMNMHMDMWHQIWLVNICDFIGFCGQEWRQSDCCVSTTRQYEQLQKQPEKERHGDTAAVQVPSQATSFFWLGAGQSIKTNNATTTLEAGMFRHSEKLRVIHLSHCTFNFSSPPFFGCSNLRFLLLDHCKDKDAAVEADHHHSHSSHDGGACFQKLWVLDLNYTDWYWLLSEKMMDLMADLRELNVKGVKNWSISHLRRGSGVRSNNCRLHRLRVTVEPTDINQVLPDINQVLQAVAFPDMSSWSFLNKIILDGCAELEEIDPKVLPPMIESFSFISNVATKIKKISFRGCGQFKSLLLRGLLESLEEMDMPGTAVKTLDLSAVQAPDLWRLVLLGCEKLGAILWPREGGKPELEVLRIDTTHAILAREGKANKQEAIRDDTSDESSSITTVLGGGRALSDLDSYISLRDAKLFRSLLNVRLNNYLQVDISSAPGGHKDVSQGINSSSGYGEQLVRAASLQKTAGNLYADSFIAVLKVNLEDSGPADRGAGDAPPIMWMWPCSPIPSKNWGRVHCYINIQDELRTKLPQGTSSTKQETDAITLPSFVCDRALTLHLHDSLSITCIPGPAPATVDLTREYLQWCRLERCPNLEGAIFTAPSPSSRKDRFFWYLKTFWSSQLLKARYIWDWSLSSFRPGDHSFEVLEFLHLDSCPRLVHVLPLYTSNGRGCRGLETLEIVCCGDLREVFPLDPDSDLEQQEPREFPSLRRIHLHELPRLQRICGRRMFAPKLKTVKIRGCWSLRRLPAVRRAGGSGVRWTARWNGGTALSGTGTPTTTLPSTSPATRNTTRRPC